MNPRVRLSSAHDDAIWSLSSGRDVLLTGSLDQTASIWKWDAEDDQKPDWTLQRHELAVVDTALDGEATLAATSSLDGTIRIWEVESGKCQVVLRPGTLDCFSVALHPKEHLVATAGQQGKVQWIPFSVEEHKSLEGTEAVVAGDQFVYCVRYSPDGRSLAVSAKDGSVVVVDVASQKSFAKIPGDGQPVRSLAWMPDSSRLVFGSNNTQASLVDVVSGVVVRSFSGHNGWVSGVDTGDKNIFVSVATDASLRVWDLRTYQAVQSAEKIHQDFVWDVALITDSTSVATVAEDGSMHLYSLNSW